MNSTVAVRQEQPALRFLRRGAKRLVPFLLLLWFLPRVLAAYLVLGALDVRRNRPLQWSTIERYFTGNGVLTWILSPFNLLLDLLALPYTNRGVFKLADLPPGHQEEIRTLIEATRTREVIRLLDAKLGDQKRGMIFFKWYGANIPVAVDVPEFHQEYRYIRTIGVSIFNKRASTGLHFGPVRASFRVLYNINPIDNPDVYIEVGGTKYRWKDDQLFIFDDTLEHQSVNQSDNVRYCLFVDILRPSGMPAVMSGILAGIGLLLQPFKSVFYKNWTFLK